MIGLFNYFIISLLIQNPKTPCIDWGGFVTLLPAGFLVPKTKSFFKINLSF